MSFTKSFPIYNGYCHIFIDKIVITTSAEVDEVVNDSSEKKRTIQQLISSIVFAIFIAGAITGLFFKDEILWGSYCVVIALLALLYFYRFSVFSKTNRIDKSTITKVQFNSSVYPAQHAHFLICFKTDNAFVQKRIIYLTADYAATNDANIQHAIAVMEEEFG